MIYNTLSDIYILYILQYLHFDYCDKYNKYLDGIIVEYLIIQEF